MASKKTDDDAPAIKIDPAAAPFIYFDDVAAYGILQGAVQVELIAQTLRPEKGGSVAIERRATAHLRCSPSAAWHLREALTKAIEMAQEAGKVQQPPTSSNKH